MPRSIRSLVKSSRCRTRPQRTSWALPAHPPERGRTFLYEESLGVGESTSTTARIADVAIITHRLWTTYFGGDVDIIGSSVELDGTTFTVVGVMPRGFNNPFGTTADVWARGKRIREDDRCLCHIAGHC